MLELPICVTVSLFIKLSIDLNWTSGLNRSASPYIDRTVVRWGGELGCVSIACGYPISM